MSKTTSLLKYMTMQKWTLFLHDSGCYRSNVKIYPTTQCKSLLIAQTGVTVVPPGCKVQTYAKHFSDMVYLYIRRSGDANRILKFLMGLKKNDKKLSGQFELLTIYFCEEIYIYKNIIHR